MEPLIKLIDLLADKQDFQASEDICKVCQDLIVSPIQCSICGSSFCQKCADKKQKCPKCGKKSEFERVDPKQFSLKCPFHQKCQYKLTPQSFLTHAITSQHDAKNKYLKELGNRCQNLHQLTLRVDAHKVIKGNQCHECGSIGSTRQQCSKCNFDYCVVCRPIQISLKGCSKGHKLKEVIRNQAVAFVCDVCLKKGKNQKIIYVDKNCNIGICCQCFEELQ